jgi:hypothetical protein
MNLRSSFVVIVALGVCFAAPGVLGAAQPKAKAQASGKSAKRAGQIYKWVDENGVTHYGQSIPPEYTENAAEEMNRSGMTVRKIDPARSAEEREALERQAEQAREEQKREAEQRRRDRALINTYGSVQEIDAARDRNLALPTQALRNMEPHLKKAQARLAKLQAQRDELAQAGKPVSDYLIEDIEAQKLEVQTLRGDMDRQAAQIAQIRTRYDADRKRFIELTELRAQ